MADFKIATNPNTQVLVGRRAQGPADAVPMHGAPGKAPPRTQQEAAQAYRDMQKEKFAKTLRKSGAGPKAHAAEQEQMRADYDAHMEAKAAEQQLEMAAPAGAPSGFSFGAAGENALGQGLAHARAIDQSKFNYKVGNNLYAPTKRMVDASRASVDKEQGLQRQVYDAKLAEAQAEADGLDLIAETKMDIADRAMAREAREVERQDFIRERLTEYDRAIQDSVSEMRRIQQEDPTAGFKNRSAWQVIRTALASAFRGGAGRDPMAYINRAIGQEMEAQRMKFGQAGAVAQASMGAMRTGGIGMMEAYRAMGADERAAEKMTEIALLEGVKAKHLENVAQYGVRGMEAENEAMLNRFDQEIAAKRFQLEKMEANNPKYFVRQGSTMGKEEQAFHRQASKGLIGTAGEALKQGLGLERDAALLGMKSDAEARKAAAIGGDGLTKEERANVTKYSFDSDNAKLEGVVRLLDDMAGQEDIVGVGKYTTDKFGSEARDFDQQMMVLEQAIGRAVSGAVISEDEAAQFREMLMAGVKWGGGEERLRKNITQVKKMFESRLETKRRGLSQAERQAITRANNPEFGAEYQVPGVAHQSEFE